MSEKRNINFIGHATPLVFLSVLLVIGSWTLITMGAISGDFKFGLKLGIDFAGGTEALISVPKEMKVSEDELKQLASDFGLTDPEVVKYSFEGDETRKGFFVRSITQRGLVVEKAPEIKASIESPFLSFILLV